MIKLGEPSPSVIYPLLGAVRDLRGLRLSGVGLGNSFFTYFNAFLLSKTCHARLIFPAWPSLRVGPLLRGQSRKRFYIGLFRPTADEIYGLQKYRLLAKHFGQERLISITRAGLSQNVGPGLNLVHCRDFSFRTLADHRQQIRKQLLEMTNVPIPSSFGWGASDYIAMHVRMGDFMPAPDQSSVNEGRANTRIPISWYVEVLRKLRKQYPHKPALIVSDGHERELGELLSEGAALHKTDSDVGDLLALSAASILVGSNSTFSRWATFLGDMPSVWVRKSDQDTLMSSSGKIAYVPIGREIDTEIPEFLQP